MIGAVLLVLGVGFVVSPIWRRIGTPVTERVSAIYRMVLLVPSKWEFFRTKAFFAYAVGKTRGRERVQLPAERMWNLPTRTTTLEPHKCCPVKHYVDYCVNARYNAGFRFEILKNPKRLNISIQVK